MLVFQNERKILLKRFFWDDQRLYKFGKVLGLNWFAQFDPKFQKDPYAFFSNEEKKIAFEILSNIDQVGDGKFIEALKQFELPKYPPVIPIFIGEHYYGYINVEKGISDFRLENRQSEVSEKVKEALQRTKGRSYYFLKAIIELYREDKWDKAYGGASWIDILAKIRELNGTYPAPRDIAELASYRMFYFKTGSRRYSTHTIPEEMISVVERTLEEWKQEKSK